MVKQEILVNRRSDLFGSSSTIVIYDDVTMLVSRFIFKAKDRSGKVGVEILKDFVKTNISAIREDKEVTPPEGLKVTKYKDGGIIFSPDTKVVFYSRA